MGYDPLLLEMGHSVYADLRQARQAALDQQATNLQSSLQDALATLHRLRQPPVAMALDAQIHTIGNDFPGGGTEFAGDRWVPVQAQIDDVLVYGPAAEDAGALTARPATPASSGDATDGSRRLDVVTPGLKYSVGLFPLHRVEQDAQAARASASLSVPDWNGALEAVQTALAEFRWYSRAPAQSLLAAYSDVVNAYVLATGPQFRPDRNREALDYLVKAKQQLDGVAGGARLAERTGTLIDRIEPSAADLRALLDDIHVHIQRELQAARPAPAYDERRMGP